MMKLILAVALVMLAVVSSRAQKISSADFDAIRNAVSDTGAVC